MNTTPDAVAHAAGQAIAALIEGIDPAQALHCKVASVHLRHEAPNQLANGVANFWCGLGYHVLREAGDQFSEVAGVLKAAAESPAWNPATEVLGRIVSDVVAVTPFSKEAAVGSAIAQRALLPAAGKALAFTPDLLKVLLGGSVLAGGALGSLAFALNRHSGESDSDIETTKARIAYYDQLSRDMQGRAKAAGALDPEAYAAGDLQARLLVQS